MHAALTKRESFFHSRFSFTPRSQKSGSYKSSIIIRVHHLFIHFIKTKKSFHFKYKVSKWGELDLYAKINWKYHLVHGYRRMLSLRQVVGTVWHTSEEVFHKTLKIALLACWCVWACLFGEKHESATRQKRTRMIL